MGTRAKNKNQQNSFNVKEKTETSNNKEIKKRVVAAKKNSQRVYSNTGVSFRTSFPRIKTRAIATEQKTAKIFPKELVSLKELWLTSVPAPRKATNNPTKTITTGFFLLNKKPYISVKIGAVVPRRAASAMEVSCTALKKRAK